MGETKKQPKMKYYSLKNILSMNADYNMIIGERSNGKTYSVLKYGIERYAEFNEQLAIIRRWDIDFIGKRGQSMFDALVKNGVVEKATKGKWTTIKYFSSRWYFAKLDKDDKLITDVEPFCYGFAINTGEHDKSTSYPKVTTVLFDECITRKPYINEEFIEFTNILSTIIRERDNVKIFMCGNTVNKYSPYFKEMGLTNIQKMKAGTIDIYQYGENNELTVAVEYCKPNENGKKSDKYFAFNNPKLKMITQGVWEIALYPHLPIKYKPMHVRKSYYITFNNENLKADVVRVRDSENRVCHFTYIMRKTTALLDKKKDIIYSTEYNPRPNWRRKITGSGEIDRALYTYFVKDKVFYQDNEVGEVVRNYLLWCKTDKGII